jgi:peptidoglycan/xylan/chitin deacetylase (PgdA/CDA1 family)
MSVDHRLLELPVWPNGAAVAVALTFDLDSDVALGAEFGGPQAATRLSLMSQARYGVVRGLPRVLKLLERQKVPATFFVPGATAEAYPDAVAAMLAAGHEVGHHGHSHAAPHLLDADEQRLEIERGLEALLKVAGIQPVGYRAPCAELTPTTLDLLVEHGLAYDSSCMGDDRPYLELAGESSILEFPIEWHLDDAAVMLMFHGRGGSLEHAGDVLRQWWEDFLLATEQHTMITLVMHPEIIGRGARSQHLERLIDQMRDHTSVWFATHRQVAEVLREQGIHRAEGSRL